MALFREIVIIFVVALVIFWPSKAKSILEAAGVEKIDVVGFKVDIKKASDAAKMAGAAISEVKEQQSAATSKLEVLVSKIQDPKTRAELKSINRELNNSVQSLESADNAVRQTLSSQQRSLERSPENIKATEGWIMLGSVDEPKQNWLKNRYKSVSVPAAEVTEGKILNLTDIAYLHADGKEKQHTKTPIIGVVEANEHVKIVKIHPVKRRSEGWILWAQVVRC
jgi:Sec-independent protein translocase protein TatA